MVHLVDAHYCADPGKYVSVLLSCLTVMLRLELPAVNVLSKIDLIENFGTLAFGLEFYTEVAHLDYLVARLEEDPRLKRHAKLSGALCELVEEFSLVGFETLDIQEKESVLRLLKVIDKANGYMYGDMDAFKTYGSPAFGPPIERDARWTSDVQERYVDQLGRPGR
mmetsp:Transcript_53210/g.130393  ORF Transcript_53210/g.130393 Transcript_53210/m.130393 type:complete len:166 (-) Transcript_53210:976-1473(-)